MNATSLLRKPPIREARWYPLVKADEVMRAMFQLSDFPETTMTLQPGSWHASVRTGPDGRQGVLIVDWDSGPDRAVRLSLSSEEYVIGFLVFADGSMMRLSGQQEWD